MRAKNIEDPSSAATQEWSDIVARLEEAAVHSYDPTGPSRPTTWLTTINPDGSPHTTPVGAAWSDGTFWFQTGDPTWKAKNLVRDARCSMSVSAATFDLVLEGDAAKVSDREDLERIVALWNAGSWPCEVDPSGTGITAPFNAPGQGPAPWFVYRITPTAATCIGTAEPFGATRWTW